ncbi:hypothetical protein [Burkholderia gladioli]|uniref:hypothetical protein n=1 Tax=Burkholderia gladioli TaxID=28095 RepID=UPI00164065C4|nr:hypothetical protein [Burkholderia gladioli]
MKVEPTCKYGHGSLDPQDAFPPTTWIIPAIDMDRFDGKGESPLPPEEFAKLAQPAFPSAFTLNIYRCKVCGYLEFFDVEVPDGEA